MSSSRPTRSKPASPSRHCSQSAWWQRLRAGRTDGQLRLLRVRGRRAPLSAAPFERYDRVHLGAKHRDDAEQEEVRQQNKEEGERTAVLVDRGLQADVDRKD